MLSIAKKKTEELLNNTTPLPLTQEQEQGIEDVLKEAREYYKKNGVISDKEWEEYRKELGF